MPPGGIEELFHNTKSNIKGRNSNILSSLRSEMQSPSPLAEVDLKKWLEESVGQREKLQKFLQTLPKDLSCEQSLCVSDVEGCFQPRVDFESQARDKQYFRVDVVELSVMP